MENTSHNRHNCVLVFWGLLELLGLMDIYLMIVIILGVRYLFNLPKSKCDNYLGQGLPFRVRCMGIIEEG